MRGSANGGQTSTAGIHRTGTPSLRHVAKLYRDRGFVAIGVRMPGHGTVPVTVESLTLPVTVAASAANFQ